MVLSVFSHSVSEQSLVVLLCAESTMGSTRKEKTVFSLELGEPRVVPRGGKYLRNNTVLYLREFQKSWCRKDKGIQEGETSQLE